MDKRLKKQYQYFATLFDRLNSNESDSGEMPVESKSEFESLIFFWQDCKSERMDSDSILLKTQKKMKEYQQKKKQIFLYKAISVASCAILILSVGLYYFYQTEPATNDFKSKLAEVESLLDSNSLETTLIMSEKKYNVEENGDIKYNAKGDVMVDQCLETKQIHDSEKLDILYVPKGRRVKLELSDGSLIWVNSNTKLVYPHTFLNETREIYVQGEIYIEAAPDKNRPFIVNTNDFDIKVLGTKFNISTYKENGSSNVVLVEGSIEVTDRQKEKLTMKPNESVSVNNGILSEKKRVDVSEYISWKDGLLLLRGEKLSIVAFKLSNYYGKPVLLDSKAADINIYGKLDLRDNLSDVIKNIESVLPIEVHEDDNQIIINMKK